MPWFLLALLATALVVHVGTSLQTSAGLSATSEARQRYQAPANTKDELAVCLTDTRGKTHRFHKGSFSARDHPDMLRGQRVDVPVGLQAMFAFGDGHIVGPVRPGRFKLGAMTPRPAPLVAFAVSGRT
jgi:hypothetical protein